jgi:hypothetical protein
MPNLNNSGIALPRFESADVTLFDAHAGSQIFLGKLRLNAIASNVFSNHPPDIHGALTIRKDAPPIRPLDVIVFAVAKSMSAETDKESSETLSVASFLSGPAFGVLKPGHLGKAVVDFCEVAQHRLDLGYRL